MTSTFPRRFLTAGASLLVATLGLAACEQDPDEPEEEPAAGAAVVETEDVEADPAAEEEPEAEPEEEGEPEPDPTAGADQCVIGYWQVDNDSFAALMTSAAEDAPTGMSVEVTGAGHIRFGADGDYGSVNEDFTFIMGEPPMVVTHVSNSISTGSYGVVPGDEDTMGDFLWVADSISVVHDEVLTVGGVAQVIDEGGDTMEVDIFGSYQGDVPVPEDQENLEGVVPITCTDDQLTYEIEGHTIVWDRTDGWD